MELSGSSLTAHMALEDPKTQTQDTKRSDGVVRVCFSFHVTTLIVLIGSFIGAGQSEH